MTDNEIIIPLKCLVMNESDCSHCKLKDKNDKCQKFLYSDVLGLIDENNRQKAEIEKLEDLNKCYYTSCQQIAKSNHEIKAEAVKEFAEKLKKEEFANGVFGSSYCRVKIDNLVKEMVGTDFTKMFIGVKKLEPIPNNKIEMVGEG